MLYAYFEKKLDSFTLRVKISSDNNTVALFGPSGAGKSMALKCIAGLKKPDKGVIKLNDRILFDSERHIDLKPQERKVGYLFQDYALFPNMTAEQNIKTGLRRLSKSERKSQLNDLLEQFQLTDLAKKRPSTLSGGEKQRVALARIFASAPDVLLLDEPFSSLDSLLKSQLIPYVRETLSSFGGDAILVSHDVQEVLQLCGSVAVISKGETKPQTSTDEFYHDLIAEYESLGKYIQFSEVERDD